MDLNAIKQRLNDFQKQANSSSGGQQKQLFWKPSIGKQVVRVVPNKYNKEFPFTEMKFYYGIGSKRVMASPSNWGEKDPIMEFAKQLRQTNDKENWRLAKKLDPKTRIFAPVVIRGEEAEGVKLWQFGKEVYQEFLNMAADEEIGDYTDIVGGRDIKLSTVGPETTGTPYNKTSIGPSLKTSTLSDDETLASSLLNDQADPMKVFKPLSYDDMKASLQEFINPEGEEEGDIVSEPAVAFDSDQKKSNYSLDTTASTVKKSKGQQFDDLFSDDKKTNDLPF
jgi:hypothetical protein|tara:strand:+ start:12352 stop:13191 length:840 start_codon:yes stop_codon:yes gene_type:complete